MNEANTPKPSPWETELESPNEILNEETTTIDAQVTEIDTVSELDSFAAEIASENKTTEDKDWFADTLKLRQNNRELMSHVAQLEQALSESEDMLQSQNLRLQSAETLVTQQAKELHTTQEQLTRLFRELESSHQTTQRQQILIETLTEQLESSQQQVAQLERNCVALQQKYNEKHQQILQNDNSCQELRSRLQRQQRQTMQFKAALEKCLEVQNTSVNLQNCESNVPETTDIPQIEAEKEPVVIESRFVPKAKPIQPWSAPPEESETPMSIPETATELAHEGEEQTPTVPVEPPETIAVETSASDGEEVTAQEEEPNSFFILEDLEPEFEQEEEDEEQEEFQESTTSNNTEATEVTPEVPQEQEFISPLDESLISKANWPSPLVYPLRHTKKRKSLAAIDLPSFPRPQQE